MELDSAEIPSLEHEHLKEYERHICKYSGESVLLDWRDSGSEDWKSNHPEDFKKHSETLARILNDLRSNSRAILEYVLTGSGTGYAFRLPEAWAASMRPITLYHVLDKGKLRRVDLDDLFQLASMLIATLVELHRIEWVHKNTSSLNVVFLGHENAIPNVSRPYLLGFDVGRSIRPGTHSIMVETTKETEHYQHPVYLRALEERRLSMVSNKGKESNDIEGYHKFPLPFDFYSLGILLAEIAIRRTLPGKADMEPLVTKKEGLGFELANDFREDIAHRMGRAYFDAVIACLNLDEV